MEGEEVEDLSEVGCVDGVDAEVGTGSGRQNGATGRGWMNVRECGWSV